MRHLQLLVIVSALLVVIGTTCPVLVSDVGGSARASAIADRASRPAYESTATLLSDSPDCTRLRFEIAASAGQAGPGLPDTPAFGYEGAGPTSQDSPVVGYEGTGPAPQGSPLVVCTGRARSPGLATTWRASASGPSRFSVLVRVPDVGRIEAVVADVDLPSVEPGESRASADPEATTVADLIDVSDPAIIRGVRVVRVTFSPFVAADGTIPATALTVKITTGPGPGANERTRRRPPPSAAFRRIIAEGVINGAPGDGGPARVSSGDARPREGAKYLLIVPDDFESAITPLVEWKEKKGIACRVAMLSETGSTVQAIQTFISHAYFGWDVPPEYVLLAGDRERIPVHNGLTLTDNFYVAVDGTDYLADILIGRIPAETAEQCAYMVAKTVAYERADVPTEAYWPASGALFVHEDGDHSDAVYYGNTEFVRDLMDSAGFSPIDTLFADMHGAGASQTEVLQVMNEGRGFVNYRGSAYAIWPAPFAFYPPNLTNGWNQPVVISATCATVGYDSDHYLSHSLTRAGSLGDPKGAVAFVGTTTSDMGLDLKRGYVDEGLFEHAFGSGRTLGEALAAGKLRLFTLDEDRQEYEGWTLMGDPELNLWTGARETLAVTHDDRIQAGPTDFVVRVSAGGQPVAGARVTCTLAPEVAVSALSGESGRAVLSFEASSAGTLSVVVTARNAIPDLGGVEVVDTGPFIVLESVSIDDGDGGNGDGLASPGESVALELSLSNTGDEAAQAVTAALRTTDEFVTIVDSLAAFGGVAPGAAAQGDQPYRIAVHEERRRDLPLELAIFIEYDDWTRLSLLPPIDVAAGELTLSVATFDDRPPGGNGDGVADPGESGALGVELLNAGECGLSLIAATLTSAVPTIAVLAGNASLVDAPPGSLVTNRGTPFVVSVAPEAPTGEVVTLSLVLSAVGHSYAYAETLDVPLTVEDAPTTLPSGPDAHGYYAFDSGDTNYQEHPTFEWIDIAPPGPGEHIRYVSSGDERMKLEILPFPFEYYGFPEYHVSIGSNGVIAFGTSNYVFGDNSGIPDLHGPEAMVAPFWDDLNPAAGGDVYQWFDSEGHRYVVQYEEVLRDGSGAAETFQVILLDPAYHPTPTGDGALIVQYESVSETNECTIGIENRYQDDGIQYGFDGSYGPHAAPLTGGLAVLFTTEPPSSPDAPWLVIQSAALDDSLGGNGNGVAELGETVSLVVELANAGTADATDLSLVLSAGDSTVVVVDGTAAMDDVPVGGLGSNESDPFSITVAGGGGDAAATLWVALGGSAGQNQSALRYDLPIASPDEAIVSLALAPCHPNPFRDGTTMRLDLPGGDRATTRVLVRVYNVAGRLVATVFDDELPPGPREITWDGNGSDGVRATSGVYFVRADAGGATRTRKAVLLR